MQKAKTRLLGVGGLALLAALTTAAINLPAKAETAGSEVTVEVVVYSATPDIKFQSPLEGYKTAKTTVEVVDIYSKATTIEYEVTYNGQVVKTINYTPEENNGVHKFNLDLSGFSYGDYVIRGIVTGGSGVKAEDITSFEYAPLMIVDTKTEKDENPTVAVEYGPDVDEVCIDVVDKEGKKVLTLCQYAEDDGGMEIELPFDEYGVPSGDYDIIATPIINSNPGKKDEAKIKYVAPDSPDVPNTGDDEDVDGPTSPETPNVPNTGSFFQKLGVSRADSIITCLIGFFTVVIFALVLMNKKKENKRK